MEEALLAEVSARLDAAAELETEVAQLTLAALHGELEACLEGESPPHPEPETAAAEEPCRAYVQAIAVEGFRGIGSLARLELAPGPGLTLVVGRNGSGKSSFSEALELLLTGDSQRWSSRRQKVWREGWRNLHHAGPVTITTDVLLDGEPGLTRIQRTWLTDELDGGTTQVLRGGETGSLDELGWQESLAAYRPFLSYNELSSMLEEGPSRLYDALASILGLEELVVATKVLIESRKPREADHRAVRAELKTLREALQELDDERARQCLKCLRGTKWKLDEVEAMVTGDPGEAGSEIDRLTRLAELRTPDLAAIGEAAAHLAAATQAVAEVRGTDADKARRLAGLLEQALAYHDRTGDGDCPICGDGSLDGDWHRKTAAAVDELRAQADAAEAAHRRLAETEQRARAFLTSPPPVAAEAAGLGVDVEPLAAAWESWHALRREDRDALAGVLEQRARHLAAAVEAVREAGRRKLEEQQAAWRRMAIRLAAWLPGARRTLAGADAVKHLKAAEKWLKQTTTDIRNDRFQPIKEEVLDHWESLRARSNVELEDVSFEGVATRRRINLDVTVDGTEGAALGVMSQGELHALALSLFLPRATLEVSPFRFLMIDDPVQAMDPARVDGLARTLEGVARDRQVVVFTHDDRLPAAVRRLEIDVNLLEIQRRAGSVVEVRQVRGPVERYLDDARALVRTTELPRPVMERVVPGLCRQSLEAACLEVVRRRRLIKGQGHADVEDVLSQNPRLLSRLALAIFDKPDKASDVLGRLNQRVGPWAAKVVRVCNKGAHGSLPAGEVGFVRDAGRLAEWILELR